MFPIFSDIKSNIEYRLSNEAFADRSLTVEEVSEAGTVPELLVQNAGDIPVLFLEGEELVGAKQNRIVNTSILVGAKSRLPIPVSCVEHGRWSRRSRYFLPSNFHSPSKLRGKLKASVSQSWKTTQRHRSDQVEVWKEVHKLLHDVSSPTAAMSDAFAAHRRRIAEFRKRLKYVDAATGMAVARARRVIALDVFDKPETCGKVWDRLLSGFVLDAFAVKKMKEPASATDVDRLLATAANLSWDRGAAVGEGEEYRAESKSGDQASALAVGEVVLHMSVIPHVAYRASE